MLIDDVRAGEARPRRRAKIPAVQLRAIPFVSFAALLAVFLIDIATPQLLVVAILLDGPIVLASFARSRRLTTSLVSCALFANVVAGYLNGVHEGYHWSAVGVADRIFAAISIVFVGYLSTAVQERSERVGRLAAQQIQAEREHALRSAFEEIRASLSTEIVQRSIVRESLRALSVASAQFLLTPDRSEETVRLIARRGGDIRVMNGRLQPELASIVQRALDEGDALIVSRDDALGRLVLDALEGSTALLLPIVDRDTRFGVLIAVRTDIEPFDRTTIDLARSFSDQSGIALAQARLFAELAARNDELGAANDALRERSNVIRDIVYALSHDLRTPLAALGMTLRQANEGAYGELPATYREIVARSVSATDELARLAETLLVVARFESGERTVDPESLSLRELAATIAAELHSVAFAKSVTIAVEASADPIVLADRGDVRRAITNLVANAITWSHEGGTVTLRVANEGEVAKFEVNDDGYGVPEVVRAMLFERFGDMGSRRGSGTGLGLYIVRRIVEDYGGRVTYAPHLPHGSTFGFTLPLQPITANV